MSDHQNNPYPPNNDQQPEGGQPRPPLFNSTAILLMVFLAVVIGAMAFSSGWSEETKVDWGTFLAQLERTGEDGADECNIAFVQFQGTSVTGEFKEVPFEVDRAGKTKTITKKPFKTTAPNRIETGSEFDQLLQKKLGDNYRVVEVSDWTGAFIALYLGVTIILFFVVWGMIRRTRDQMMGGSVSTFSRSPAKRYSSSDSRITFDDVAGIDRVKDEVQELVDYLKNPEKFARMGARVPKGVLLMGPPGTGKTLLARAVAGEAGVPFFSVNGSEFIQMFVGVGASRVRDLFNTAKMQSPAILFIDEIDAVGRLRGTGVGGGHDEREQTLNQILSEMDGFTQTESVIVLAATNRPDVLDPALLRPGRFDRHIVVDRPTYKGRLAIFKVHARDIPMADDVDFERLAAGTVGVTGADIQNLVNEATLWATRQNKEKVEMADFEDARDKIFMGMKREEVLTDEEKRMTAYHEAGHTIVGWLEPENDRVHKVTIIPRGRSLGATHFLPEEDKVHIKEEELYAQLAFILGGRAAERIVYDELGTGAANDLQQATAIARNMVMRWGMSERLGPVAFRDTEDHPFLGKEMSENRAFSEHTAQVIDEEICRVLTEAEDRAVALLEKNRDKLDLLAEALEKEEELTEAQITEVIGPPNIRERKKTLLGGSGEAKKEEEKSETNAEDGAA